MTTTHTRGLVSLVASITLTLTIGACASAGPRSDYDVASAVTSPGLRFDNDSPEFVHVYLVDDRRQWFLGRVAPGAITTLRVPQSSLTSASGPIRLAVIAGSRLTLQAARDPDAKFTLPLAPTAMMLREWKFSRGEVSPQWRPGMGIE